MRDSEKELIHVEKRVSRGSRRGVDRRRRQQSDLGGGKRRIVLATDRYISFYEARNQPRYRDYDMSLIVVDVDAKGEGQLAMGVQLTVDTEKKTLVVENFGTEPVRLTKIHKRD